MDQSIKGPQEDKHFKKVAINVGILDYLSINEKDTFANITFDAFRSNIVGKISVDAFGKSQYETIKNLTIISIMNHEPPKYDVWKLLSGLINAENIFVCLRVSEIPSQAFSNEKQSKLSQIDFSYVYSVTLRKNAFYNLPNLNTLNFHSEIQLIENQAFAL